MFLHLNKMNNFANALKVLQNEGVIIFPTDTVMGVGCSMSSKKGIERLYSIKRREKDKPTAVLVSDIEMAEKFITRKPDMFLTELLKKYWPGALTVVVKASNLVPKEILSASDEVGLRIPNHNIRELINKLGTGLVATSANFPNDVTPIKFLDINDKFLEKVDFAIEEDSLGSKSSTVIRYLGDGKVEYIRKGKIIIS